ncbi:uncharacterized protein K460DRAFT_312816 [Cucurbitaria berberidis CBS 394.84]|uniref:DUF7703 domain-containing protein n=1 Tax=Cucurbitaria berberidis CBS 394.84 TaxID=1168544 RepID=A0A9P4GHT1_9PLEO|nr:uncharacterized protein K460DRAFT_312816 [Cucurbitaria berberidis CBS 394.84]KAF1845897.1 hypothetical protein K460DRAFT_312816 [Cucurbitaria berberidis CBS 394.84]
MASSSSMGLVASATSSALPWATTPAQGSLDSAGAGITGGYTGGSLPLQITIAFLIGLALYNALELIVLAFVTFQRYRGLYFWSLVISAFGIIPYSLGFLIKFFQLLDPNKDVGYVAVFFLSIGWYPMVTGQSIVLWSRLHLVTNSRRVLRWSLYMIVTNGIVLHSVTTVLTFGSNSNTLSRTTLGHFVKGYSIMEKIQMVGFFVQEVILSIIYIRETVRLLRLAESVQDDVCSFDNGTGTGNLRNASVRKTMYQLLAINVIIITMDLALLAVEFANLYLIETTLKGVVYSIKLKLEFAVLGKLVQLVRDRTSSNNTSDPHRRRSPERRAPSTGLTLEKTDTGGTSRGGERMNGSALGYDFGNQQLPDFVDPRNVHADFTHAEAVRGDEGWETRKGEEGERWRRRTRVNRGSWIDEEMDKHHIG